MKTFFPAALALVAGLLLGVFLFDRHHDRETHEHESEGPAEAGGGATVDFWTCSMHPQVQSPNPGKCPICAMNLIPLSEAGAIGTGRSFTMNEEARILARITTEPAALGQPVREVALYGSIVHDETRMLSVSARFPARIDALHVDYEGKVVKQGDPLATLYSPELLALQSDLFTAAKFKNPSSLRGARERLRQWGFSPEQIAEIEKSGQPSDQVEVDSPSAGIVTRRSVVAGDYVDTGDMLFMLADHSVVWLVLEAYEPDLPWLKLGQTVTFTTPTFGDREFTGEISFIDHEFNTATRTARIRAAVDNPGMPLKPGMHVRGKAIGTLDTDRALLVPASAVLHTGKRSLVYVEDPEAEDPTYTGREILLGPRAGDRYVVEAGLNPGERVVVSGAFAIDSALQIQGRDSMMLPPEDLPPLYPGMEAPDDFLSKTDAVIENYLAAQNALADDDFGGAKQAVDALVASARETPHLALGEEASGVWIALRDRLEEGAGNFAAAAKIAEARNAFAPLSQALDELVQRFGTGGPALHVTHCPMAVDNQGADWLQVGEQLRNPYMGTAMQTCGEITGRLDGRLAWSGQEHGQEHGHGEEQDFKHGEEQEHELELEHSEKEKD